MTYLDTPLGSMLAVAGDGGLFLLSFADYDGIRHEIETLSRHTGQSVVLGHNDILDLVTYELSAYFRGSLTAFTTPYYIWGTPFQSLVWAQLGHIPYGQTQGYHDQAIAIGNGAAYRAVANANAANHLAVILPCHRVVPARGGVGGYRGGSWRKQWLIDHEVGVMLSPVKPPPRPSPEGRENQCIG